MTAGSILKKTRDSLAKNFHAKGYRWIWAIGLDLDSGERGEGDGDMHKVNTVGPWPTADRSPATLGFLTETSICYKKGSGWQRRLRRTHL